ncbi:PREDICTED: vomeronasal type-1 receptor 4 [Propithecus coquereli]|uniref:vomeronasal type-1 receptor 4 n=1 Tax=Propithecus coquereli TaxID=379532 RepID=UPI00063F0EF4|nr:PREDICTED: vomeronasal type-1 receptor 4 [Propithecus coquereli]
MASRDLAIGVVCLSQTVVGLLGNFSLLCHYLFLYFTGCRLRSTDLIVEHLIVANFLSLLSKGVPQTMAALGLIHFLNDIGCKLVFYVHRVGRGVSINTTCLLSVFQVITISPRNSRWAELKEKAPKYIGFSIFLCWILHMMLNIVVLLYVTGKWSNTNITMKKDLGYCSGEGNNEISVSLCVPMLSIPDVFCVGLMLWASGSMVFILFRHKQQVQHIRKNHLSPRSSPESRATHSILVLVSTFVSSYILSCLFQVCIVLSDNPGILLVNTSALISVCFPTVCPFILMSRVSREHRLCFAWIKITKSPKSIINV